MFSRNLEVLKLRRDLIETNRAIKELSDKLDALDEKLIGRWKTQYWGPSHKTEGLLDTIDVRLKALENANKQEAK